MKCPSCRATIPDKSKFCLECGAAVTVTTPTSSVSAERRQISVMFCDLADSTRLSSRLDPEDMHTIITRYHRSVTEAVESTGGFVAKYMGDGVLCYFGYPQAREDDPERAVRSALSLVEAVPKLPFEALQVRIGIATGVVVVGDLIGRGEAQERGIVGETPNLAARLQGFAKPNSVVIEQRTRQLLGDFFEYTDLGATVIKGLDRPVQAYGVLKESRIEGRFEALRAGALTPFIGRQDELGVLLQKWREAKSGSAQVVLIVGEPGIGKSRLIATFLENIQGDDNVRLRYFCSPHHQNTALHPVIGQLERAAGFARNETPDAKVAKLTKLLASASQYDDSVILLADLMSVPTGGSQLNLAPERRKERTFEVLISQLKKLAGQQPVVLIYEDMHWIDPTSYELLNLVIERTRDLPVLLVAASRPEFKPEWVGLVHLTALNLSRLCADEAATLVTRVVDGLPRDTVDEIVQRTDGVPLFVEELTKAIAESGPQDRPDAALAVPATLHASLLARLDRLGPVAKEIAQVGAAIGREFSYLLLAAVAERSALELETALNRLTEAGLVFQRGTAPEAAFLFKHALVQDTAYGTLLRSRRQTLHARIVSALEGQFAPTQPELLAHHCAEAGLFDKAVGYFLAAGQRSMARSAMREAGAQLTGGLDLLSSLPEGRPRRQHELELRIALGRALMATHGWAAPETGETYGRARLLCEQLDQTQHLGAALTGQWSHDFGRGELGLALERAETLCRLGETRNDAISISLGRLSAGQVHFYLGDFTRARADLEHSLGLFDPKQRRDFHALTTADPHVMTLVYLARTQGCLGYLAQAQVSREAALAEARHLEHIFTLAFALGMACLGASSEGSVMAALRWAEELLALTAEHDFPFWRTIAAIHRDCCLVIMGRSIEGLPRIAQHFAAYRSMGGVVHLPLLLSFLADACAHARLPAEGLTHLSEAAEIIETTQNRAGEAELHRVRGDLLLRLDDHAAAEDNYAKALAVGQRQRARLWELRAATSLARLWRARGKCSEARDLLRSVHGWFTEGFNTPVLREARALVGELQCP
jgi:class 3 adenylate cyclase/tetratricopeptide (TPR) repeat protein